MLLALIVFYMLVAEVLCIELNMITENVIKGKPIILFCYIPKFTNIASFDMPNGLPFRKVYCNNRDTCSINEHKIFNVNSNSTGLTLTLKDLSATIEGEYVCTYKGKVKTYSLNISRLDIIDPKDACNLTKEDAKYKCQTKCLKLNNNQTIEWEFETDSNETFRWNTSAARGDCDCCKDKKQFLSHRDFKHMDGMLKCSITLSSDVTLWSPQIRVSSDGNQPAVIVIISVLLTTFFVTTIVVSYTCIWYKKRKRSKEPHTGLKVKSNLNSKATDNLIQRDQINSNEDDPMVNVEEGKRKA